MSVPKIEERTLYHPIISELEKKGFKAVGETKVVDKHPDVLFKINSLSFVIEVKIGKPDIGLKAVAQASDYAKKLNTQNIIILIYPDEYRNIPITDPSIVTKYALNNKITALVLTDYWTESIIIEPSNLIDLLKEKVISKKVKVDFNTTVKLIESYVRDLNSIVYQIKTEDLVTEVVNKLDLFLSLGELKDEEIAKNQIINLASFLLFNQLLFYYIYKKKTRKKLADLEEISKVQDIQKYFDEITKIDYQSIYRINILSHVPDDKIVIETLNQIIKAIKLLRAEHITHDLAGRFFHDLIPSDVRKVLAAFYTHPSAATILTALTINSCEDNVIDPACGSGTLLVAAYKRKEKLYNALYGYKKYKQMHEKFIENDITGIDIMPFAAHITTINLTLQNIEQETNIVRIGTSDSIELAELLIRPELKKGIEVKPYTEEFQTTIFKTIESISKQGSISANGKGEKFYIKPFHADLVIMNPPFSDREKLPPEMRKKLNISSLVDICGNQVNLWGYFLALAHLLLKTKGEIAAVIPINIARGKATEKIREFLLQNYHIRYIIKPVGDMAFSESSAFKDVLLIAEKRKVTNKDHTTIVFFKKSIRSVDLEEAEKISEKLDQLSSKERIYKGDEFDLINIPQKELTELKENLMPVIGVSHVENIKILSDFLNIIKTKGKNKIRNIKNEEIEEGFHASPAGISELTFITRPIKENRVQRAFMILENENKTSITVKLKGSDVKINIKRNKLLPALRTVTNVQNFSIDENKDYFIKDEPDKIKSILMFTKIKDKQNFNWQLISGKITSKETHLAVARRFNPYSPNTHFFAFYSSDQFITPHTFKIIKTNKNESSFQVLFLNSVITLTDIMSLKEQTTGQFTDIMETDLSLFKCFNFNELSNRDIKILERLFNKLKTVKFPSILEQIKNRFPGRIELDKTILKVIGLNDKEINKHLPIIYNAIVSELES